MKPGLIATQRMQAVAWLLLGLVFGFLTLRALHFDDGVAFLHTDEGPAWIAAPLPMTAHLIAQDPQQPPESIFVRSFTRESDESPATLIGRALRQARVRLNGKSIDLVSEDDAWRTEFEADLGPFLRAGRNTIEIGVKRADGPALLQAKLILPDREIETDSAWEVTTPNGVRTPAWRAHDEGIHPGSRLMPKTGEVLPRIAPWLIGLFALSAGGTVLFRRKGWPLQHAPLITLGSVSLLWIWIFFVKLTALPTDVGFDATAHLAYIDYLQTHLSLPTAQYGFATYHPPAFYVLAASTDRAWSWISGATAYPLALHIIPFISGWTNILLTGWVARRLWPGQALRPSLAIAAAGLLPMNIYMSAYVSNEPFHAAVVSGCLALAASLLLSNRIRAIHWILITLGLGLAILTKFTSLLIAPVIAFFVSLRLWWLDGKTPLTSALRFGAILLGCALIGGWFYLRNYLILGDPFVWNLDVPGAPTWWLRPGFHTSAWYLSFGESLTHPYFAGYASFWDGLYSTLWGDGLVGGMAQVETRHGLWNDDFQSLVYPLALPATGLLALGYFRLAIGSLSEPDLGRRIFLSLITCLLALLGFSLFLISLALPFYAQAKAFYILAGLLPLCLALAEGLGRAAESCSQGSRLWLPGLYYGWLGMLGGAIALTYAA